MAQRREETFVVVLFHFSLGNGPLDPPLGKPNPEFATRIYSSNRLCRNPQNRLAGGGKRVKIAT